MADSDLRQRTRALVTAQIWLHPNQAAMDATQSFASTAASGMSQLEMQVRCFPATLNVIAVEAQRSRALKRRGQQECW